MTPCEPHTINPITQSASRSTKERRLGTRQDVINVVGINFSSLDVNKLTFYSSFTDLHLFGQQPFCYLYLLVD